MRLVVQGLSGERGGTAIFSDVTFTLAAGAALVVSGPNGVGKSTLLRVIAGLLPTAAGTVGLADGGEDFADVGAASHYIGHLNAMKSALTIGENLSFWQRFSGKPLLTITSALERVGLSALETLPYGTLSTGQRRRAALARLLVTERPIWLLDEPTAGLDQAAESDFAMILAEHRRGGGIVVAASHLPLGLEAAQSLVLEGGG